MCQLHCLHNIWHIIRNTRCSIKTCHFIFHRNSSTSWWIFTLHVPMETKMNTVQNKYKIYNFTLTVFNSSNDTCSSEWPWWIVSWSAFDQTGCLQLMQKVVQCWSFQSLLGNSLISIGQKILQVPTGFYQKFIFGTQHIPFHCLIIMHKVSMFLVDSSPITDRDVSVSNMHIYIFA